MLVLTLKPGQRLQIGDAVVQIMPDQGRLRVKIDADKSIPVRRIKKQVEEPEQVEPAKPEEVLPIKSSSTQEILRNMMAANKRK